VPKVATSDAIGMLQPENKGWEGLVRAATKIDKQNSGMERLATTEGTAFIRITARSLLVAWHRARGSLTARPVVSIRHCLHFCKGIYLTRAIDIGSLGSFGRYNSIVLVENLAGLATIFLYSLAFLYIARIC
jgi:hypothetical protein